MDWKFEKQNLKNKKKDDGVLCPYKNTGHHQKCLESRKRVNVSVVENDRREGDPQKEKKREEEEEETKTIGKLW